MDHIPGTFGRDMADVLADNGPSRHAMHGFDACYRDIVHYILLCTHRIWEQKDIGLIATHYSDDCPIWLLSGPVAGMAGVVEGTTATLAAFPDRTLHGEAVIWSGDAEAGYLSSHRITSTATHLGAGEFGPPSGRVVHFLTIADCLCRGNRIVEEWLVRDNSHIALQLGLRPAALAATAAGADAPGTPAVDWWQGEWTRAMATVRTPFRDSPMPPATEGDGLVGWFVDQVLHHRRLALVRDLYHPNVRLHAPGGRRLFGHGEVIGWLAALLGTVAGSRVAVDHVAVQPVSERAEDGVDIAWRWTLAGRHMGPALYGPATGRNAVILGVTHWRMVGGRIAAEWTVFDEIAVSRQLAGRWT